MPQTDFLNKNLYRRYPLQDVPGDFTGNAELPLQTIVDTGFIINPLVAYDVEYSQVYLFSVWRDAGSGKVYLDFRCDPDNGFKWVFERDPSDSKFHISNELAIPEGESYGYIPTADESCGTAFLVTGDLVPLLEELDPGETWSVLNGSFPVEPCCVQYLGRSFVRSVVVANDIRPELQCLPWPEVTNTVQARARTEHDENDFLRVSDTVYIYNPADTHLDDDYLYLKPDDVMGAGRWVMQYENSAIPVAVYAGPLLTLEAGFNCNMSFSITSDSVTIGAIAGDGSGPICDVVPGYDTIEGCRCIDGIRSIDGLRPVGGSINLNGQFGVLAEGDPATHTITVRLDASKANVCDIPPNCFDPELA